MTSPSLPPPTLGTPTLPSAPPPPPDLHPAVDPPATAVAPELPTLPVSDTAPSIPAPTPAAPATGSIEIAPVDTTPAAEPSPTPSSSATTSSRGSGRLLVAVVVAVAALGGLAWFVLGRAGDDTGADAAVTENAESSADGSIGQIGVDAINDAEAVVGDLNANDEEAALLAELGLDATGEPITAPVSQGHQFTWTVADGSSATVVVDGTTGDFVYTDDTGLEFRSIGATTVARLAPDLPWDPVETGDVAGLSRLGFDRPLTTDDLLAGPVAEHIDAGAGSSLWSLDDEAFAAANSAARDQWLSSVGLAAGAPNGRVTIVVAIAADGSTLSFADIERPATGERVGYVLDRLLDEAPDFTTDGPTVLD